MSILSTTEIYFYLTFRRIRMRIRLHTRILRIRILIKVRKTKTITRLRNNNNSIINSLFMWLGLDSNDKISRFTINMGLSLSNETMFLSINHARLDLKLKSSLFIHQPVSLKTIMMWMRRIKTRKKFVVLHANIFYDLL